MRSAVIIQEHERVALIERVRDRYTYYLFPGGTIEDGETAAAAARREAYEELGVAVEIHALAAVVTFHDQTQYYYHATISTGQFGMGAGEELSSDSASARGSYRPVWLACHDLARYDVRPHALAHAIGTGMLWSMPHPLQIDEAS